MSLITALMVSLVTSTALASTHLPSGVYESAEGTSVLLTNHGTHVSMVIPQMPNAVIVADLNGSCQLSLANHQIDCVVHTAPHTLTVSLPAYEITSTARYTGPAASDR